MPRGFHAVLTKEDLRSRIKEIEERIKDMDRREHALEDLKKWLTHHKLGHLDVLWMYRQLKPQRADQPVKSKKPLHPQTKGGKGKIVKGDAEFRAAMRAARKAQGLHPKVLAKKVGVSPASVDNWEAGRNVPKDETRIKILKALGLPLELGAAASKALTNGHAGV